MSDPIYDGGPAFPGEQSMAAGLWNPTWDPGMSLRAYLAGQALVGILVAWNAIDTTQAANLSVEFADAVLAALEEKK